MAAATNMRVVRTTEGDKSPETLHLEEEPVPVPVDRQVLIRIHWTAVNRADTLQRRGAYPVPPGESTVLGLECSGEIAALSEGCELGSFKVGDRVMALLGGGGYGEYAVADERSIMRVPEEMEMKSAGAIVETWLTAYQLLHFVGRVQAGEHVVVHAAGSGVGLAACQLARQAGAVPIATARTAAKLEVAAEHGAAKTIDTSSTPDWAAEVLAFTGGRGADVILDPVGASYSEANAKAIAVDGRWAVYGLMGGAGLEVENALGVLLRKRATIVGTTLRSRTLEYKGDLVAAFWGLAGPLFKDGTFKPIIDTTLPLEKANEAHALMEQNANTGKILLQVVQ